MTTGTLFIMSGTLTSANGVASTAEGFAVIASFFNSSSNYTRIACSGTFGAPGAGDGTREGNFGVWRAVSASQPYDVILKWSYNDNWAGWDAPVQSWGVGILTGIHSSSVAWAGTTNNDGLDTTPLNPFISGTMVYSRRNSAGGLSTVTGSKRGFMDPGGGTTYNQGTKIICVGDAEFFTILVDASSNNSFDGMYYFGPYIPARPEFTLPRISFSTNTAGFFLQNTTFGAVAKSAVDGALTYKMPTNITITSSIPTPEAFKADYTTKYAAPYAITTSYLPAPQEYPIFLTAQETGAGYVGYLEDIRVTYASASNYSMFGVSSSYEPPKDEGEGTWTYSGGDRMVVSQSTNGAYPTITIPWTGSVPFLSGNKWEASTVFLTGSMGDFGSQPRGFQEIGALGSVTVTNNIIQGGTAETLYRGLSGGSYVYQRGTPPAGATDITIVGEISS